MLFAQAPRATQRRRLLVIDKADGLYGMHAQALAVWQKRAEVISSNLANADTPDYLARDVDFRQALKEARSDADGGPLQMAATAPGHIGGNSPPFGGIATMAYRIPTQPSMDGNTVDAQVEQASFAGNAVHYQASLSFLTGSIKEMRTAITGTSS
jgi:flagellar basal-body rod protein FlgB